MKDNNLSLEELKKSFIIDRGKYEKEKLPDFIKRTLKYCKMNSEGGIHIENFSLTIRDKIAISLVARFLANKLEPTIKSEMSGEELSTILDIEKPGIFARLKELTDIKMVTRLDKGTYEIVPYYIETLLNEMDSKYYAKETKSDMGHGLLEKEDKKSVAVKKSKKNPEVVVKEDFLEKIMNIDKTKYAYINDLSSAALKTLGILNMVRKELDMEWLSSPQILKILSEKFRIKAIWSTISVALKVLDQKSFVESRPKKGHSTAREYRIMKQGEDYLETKIQKPSEKGK